MFKNKKGIADDELKKMIYQRNPAVKFVEKDGIVTIVKENNHPIQRFFRKYLRFNIPEQSTLELDKYGSFVFHNLDGKTNVYDLGKMLGNKFKETRKYQYTRLVIYLRELDQQNHLIIKVKNK